MDILDKTKQLIRKIEEEELNQKAMVRSKQQLSSNIKEFELKKKLSEEELDIVTNAIAILKQISDGVVTESKKFIEESLNSALERIFKNSVRKIRIKEYTTRGTYPQLELELTVEGGEKRLLSNSGHGLEQIVSLLCILSLIVMTGNRRLLIMDEVLSGLSARARMIVDDIMWTFVSIGFQFIINEHGFIPKGSHVIQFELKSGVSAIVADYVAEKGTYLDGTILSELVKEENKVIDTDNSKDDEDRVVAI